MLLITLDVIENNGRLASPLTQETLLSAIFPKISSLIIHKLFLPQIAPSLRLSAVGNYINVVEVKLELCVEICTFFG